MKAYIMFIGLFQMVEAGPTCDHVKQRYVDESCCGKNGGEAVCSAKPIDMTNLESKMDRLIAENAFKSEADHLHHAVKMLEYGNDPNYVGYAIPSGVANDGLSEKELRELLLPAAEAVSSAPTLKHISQWFNPSTRGTIEFLVYHTDAIKYNASTNSVVSFDHVGKVFPVFSQILKAINFPPENKIVPKIILNSQEVLDSVPAIKALFALERSDFPSFDQNGTQTEWTQEQIDAHPEKAALRTSWAGLLAPHKMKDTSESLSSLISGYISIYTLTK